MNEHYEKVKSYLTELGYPFTEENPSDGVVIVNDVKNGIINLVIDCEFPLVIFEQFIFEVGANASADVYKRLLQINRNLVHGAFVLDDHGSKVIFRDTLQLENIDLNEVEGTLAALGMAMAENSNELIQFAKAQ